MKRWLGLFLMMACGDPATPEATGDVPCTDSDGTLQGSVVVDYLWEELDPEPAALAKVRVVDEDGTAWELQADEGGVFHSGLPAGTWDVRATSAGGDCISTESVQVMVEACETTDVVVVIDDCVDG